MLYSPASEIYVPAFQNTLSSDGITQKNNTESFNLLGWFGSHYARLGYIMYS